MKYCAERRQDCKSKGSQGHFSIYASPRRRRRLPFLLHPVQAPQETRAHLRERVHPSVPRGAGGQHSISHSGGAAFCENRHWPHGHRAGKSCWPEESQGDQWGSCGPPVLSAPRQPAPLACLPLSTLLKPHALCLWSIYRIQRSYCSWRMPSEPRPSTQSWWVTSPQLRTVGCAQCWGLGMGSGWQPGHHLCSDLVRAPHLSEPPLPYFQNLGNTPLLVFTQILQEYNEWSLKQQQ